MDITFYLVELLRLHDCVIVPDLGGFVTNYRPAEMDLVNNSFMPPVKEIIFTGMLSKNDGLLVNYISEIEGVGYFEARQIISEFVDEMWSKLENGEKVVFQNIGSLQFDRNEKLIFEPDVHENLLLDSYGMESFHFPHLVHNEIFPTKRLFNDKEAVRPVFSSRKVKALAIGIPIILALIIIPVSKFSWKNSTDTNLQTSNSTILPTNILNIPSPIVPIDSIENKVTAKIDSVSPDSAVTQKQIQPVTIQTNERYRVIGGCFKLRENADSFVRKLQNNGFKPELKVQPNGMFLVIIQSYSDRNNATMALKGLREAEPKAGYFISAN